jgi:hypothetical protein
MKEEYFVPIETKEPNTEIWIADNLCYHCISRHNWFTIFMAKILLGWKIIKK